MLQCRCLLSPDGVADAWPTHPPPGSVKPVCTLQANPLSPDGVADGEQLLTRHHTSLRQGRAGQGRAEVLFPSSDQAPHQPVVVGQNRADSCTSNTNNLRFSSPADCRPLHSPALHSPDLPGCPPAPPRRSRPAPCPLEAPRGGDCAEVHWPSSNA